MRMFATVAIASLALVAGAASAQAQYYYDDEPDTPIFYRNGQQCQQASSGRVICRPLRRERYGYGWGGGGYDGYRGGYGYRRGYSENPVWYQNGRRCQQASSGRVICR